MTALLRRLTGFGLGQDDLCRLALSREGWLGEMAGLEAMPATTDQKLQAMQQIAGRHTVTHLGMPNFRATVGRSTDT